jgi:hypothetical protein
MISWWRGLTPDAEAATKRLVAATLIALHLVTLGGFASEPDWIEIVLDLGLVILALGLAASAGRALMRPRGRKRSQTP